MVLVALASGINVRPAMVIAQSADLEIVPEKVTLSPGLIFGVELVGFAIVRLQSGGVHVFWVPLLPSSVPFG